jgi:pSer/pThr/pTyr-binding forkhead associated (FHA) protein
MIYKAPTPAPPEPPPPPPEPPREVATLTIDGRKHEVSTPSVVLGRSREADVRVADVNASRRHAELRQEDSSYWIVDLGSTNGVEVNGKRVDRARLSDGDRITIGTTEVVFGISQPS